MKITEIENSFKAKLENYENKWDFDTRTLHLVEEVGELAEIILQYKGIKNPKKNLDDIRVALADIIDDVYAIALLKGISLEELTVEVLKNDEK